MHPLIIASKNDYGLTNISGGIKPRWFMHADQIPGSNGAAISGTSGNFPNLGPAINTTQNVPPVINTTGFNSLRSLNFSSSKYLQVDSLASDITNMNDSICWIIAANMNTSAAGPVLLDYGLNTSSSRYWEWNCPSNLPGIYFQGSGSPLGIGGSSISSVNNVPAIFGISRTSGVLTIKVLYSSGEITPVNSVACVNTDSTSFDRFIIGAEWNNTGISAGTYANFNLRAAACFIGNISNSNLTSCLAHFRDKLNCPV